MRRVAVVVNPAARGGAAGLAEEVADVLRRHDVAIAILPTAARGDGVALARRVAAEGGADVIAAVGGDGTAREVAQGIAEGLGTWPAGDGRATGAEACRLLVVPAGTGNSMHRALWADRSWQEVLDLALRGATVVRHVDLLRIGDDGPGALLGASAGFLRWAVEATARFPELAGRELYAAAGLAAAQEVRPFAGRVAVDGDLVAEGPMALAAVGGARRRGGSLVLLPRSRLDDGRLDVCVLGASGPEEAIALLMSAMEGTHLDQPGVRYAQGREVLLESLDGPLPFEHDGDLWERDDRRLQLRCVPGAVPVVSPQAWEE